MAETTEPEQQISILRAKIDLLDEQIVDLLNRRAEQSLAIRALKPEANMGLYDPKREEEIFDRLVNYNKGPMYPDDVRQVYTTILKVSKEMRA